MGTFSQIKNIRFEGMDQEDGRVCYAPLPEMLHSYNFNYTSQLPTNFPSVDHKELLIRQIVDKVNKVDYRTIANSAELSETALICILRQILTAVETAMRKNY